jgi:hypothetical protein
LGGAACALDVEIIADRNNKAAKIAIFLLKLFESKLQLYIKSQIVK